MIDQIFFTIDTVCELNKNLFNPVYAFHSAYDDVLDRVVARDSDYVTLGVSERLILAFPYEAPSERRSFVLVTTGYYKPKGRHYSTFDKATFPNGGRLLAFDPQNGKIHIVYDRGTHIAYESSLDGGEKWGEGNLG